VPTISLAIIVVVFVSATAVAAEEPRPNILWITSEDHGPHMGCYGDTFATTPNVDALAAKGMIYTRCWSNAPVCAPARTTLISGMYPPSTGSEHMRSMVSYPAGKTMYPQFLREAGYYCTNHAKEDYNLTRPGKVWDDSSRNAHWRNRAAWQPFFAVFNSTKSHESQIRTRPHKQDHDPDRVRVPAYHPDTPEVREDWAQYYDKVTEADADAGKVLQELEEDGLADDTIVFYYGDHGSGMPRNKRWPYNSGLHVPLVVYIPDRFKHLASPDYAPGNKSDRLVSFVDFAPTLLSLVGIEPPDWMQGHAFLGKFQAPPQPFIYGFRGRMDERFDMVRSVTDGRYVYIRNYMPHRIYGQHVAYMFQTPTTQAWKRLHDEGKLTPAQEIFWNTKPPEELYDLQSDPDEVHNLAGDPRHREILQRMGKAQTDLVLRIRDVGFLPEGDIHSRSDGASPYDMARDGDRYPLDRILKTATAATRTLTASGSLDGLSSSEAAMHDSDSAVRYWGALGVLMRGAEGVSEARRELQAALKDESPYVRIVAAEALGRFGTPVDAEEALAVLVELGPIDRNGVFVSMAALNALESLGDKADPAADAIRKFPAQGDVPDARYNSYVPRLLESLTGAE
jgi:uncharacterized sulfatase